MIGGPASRPFAQGAHVADRHRGSSRLFGLRCHAKTRIAKSICTPKFPGGGLPVRRHARLKELASSNPRRQAIFEIGTVVRPMEFGGGSRGIGWNIGSHQKQVALGCCTRSSTRFARAKVLSIEREGLKAAAPKFSERGEVPVEHKLLRHMLLSLLVGPRPT